MFTKDVDLLLARAQVMMAFLFGAGFIGLLAGLIFVPTKMTPVVLTAVTTMLTVLGTLLTLQMNFFYARQRPHALPDPSTTTTTTTSVTTPTGDPNAAPLTTAITVTPAPAAATAEPGPRQ